MSAAMQTLVAERPNSFDERSTKACLRTWGNWYIRRSAHEFGWASHYACLNYFGLFVNGHKILFDTPERVRFVDVAVGQLNELLREALALEYWWLCDLKTGELITRRDKAYAMGLKSPSQFKEFVRVATECARRSMESIDCRRTSAKVS